MGLLAVLNTNHLIGYWTDDVKDKYGEIAQKNENGAVYKVCVYSSDDSCGECDLSAIFPG